MRSWLLTTKQPGVQDIPERVSQQINAENGDTEGRPGKIPTHGATAACRWAALLSMPPHEAMLGEMPTPKNLRLASTLMAQPRATEETMI